MKAFLHYQPAALATLIGIASLAQPSLAEVIYQEGGEYELHWGVNDTIVQLALGAGSNEIIGFADHIFDSFDPFGFIVPLGYRVNSMVFRDLTSSVALSAFSGNDAITGYVGGVNAGPSDVGQNLLPLMGLPNGFGAGTYSARIFAGYGQPQYRLDLVVEAVPVITGLAATPSIIWPPNNKMVAVAVDYIVQHPSYPTTSLTTTLSITSNEPPRANQTPDWQIVDDHHVLLRAKRDSRGSGRVYAITITSTDPSGDSVSSEVSVTVPHS